MAGLSILIVDDSAVARDRLHAGILSVTRDCQVFECESVLEAGRFLGRATPDVVFLDLDMPKINGIELLTHLDKIVAGRHAPVIVSISADMSPATLAVLKERGAYDVLPKPFVATAIAAVLARVAAMACERHVLVVDDSATVRSVVKRIIERSRFRLVVEEAGTGADALRLIRSTPFEIAFVDVEMPGIDGLEAAGEMLAINGDVKVVMMSGRDDEPRRRAAQHIGVPFFLKKPFFARDVDAVLHSVYGIDDAAFVSAAERESFQDLDFEAAAARRG
jgi:CheY-like chemotaxis protein